MQGNARSRGTGSIITHRVRRLPDAPHWVETPGRHCKGLRPHRVSNAAHVDHADQTVASGQSYPRGVVEPGRRSKLGHTQLLNCDSPAIHLLANQLAPWNERWRRCYIRASAGASEVRMPEQSHCVRWLRSPRLEDAQRVSQQCLESAALPHEPRTASTPVGAASTPDTRHSRRSRTWLTTMAASPRSLATELTAATSSPTVVAIGGRLAARWRRPGEPPAEESGDTAALRTMFRAARRPPSPTPTRCEVTRGLPLRRMRGQLHGMPWLGDRSQRPADPLRGRACPT
jgi:hypothetical protein